MDTFVFEMDATKKKKKMIPPIFKIYQKSENNPT